MEDQQQQQLKRDESSEMESKSGGDLSQQQFKRDESSEMESKSGGDLSQHQQQQQLKRDESSEMESKSGGDLSQHQQQHVKPMTYGDVFNAPGEVGKQPITPEDAALMQSAESMAFGRTQKGGAASVMQAAADYNVKTGAIPKDAHNPVADAGVTVKETRAPGVAIDTEFVGGVPVAGVARPTPTSPEIAAATAVTVGEALEAAALGAIDQPVEQSDASAIQSAESRATGVSMTIKGGVASVAQAAAELNPRVDAQSKTTLGDILTDATSQLPADKVVTMEDAAKVLEAEARHSATGMPRPGGVGAAMLTAAEINERSGLTA